jgi:hypothetical protein
MARSLKINEKKHDTSLYDSDTGASCKTEKVVDITEDCPKANKRDRALLLFTRSKRGRIVQINYGLQVHFFVDELDRQMNVPSRDDTFGLFANRLGLTKPELRMLIDAQCPA